MPAAAIPSRALLDAAIAVAEAVAILSHAGQRTLWLLPGAKDDGLLILSEIPHGATTRLAAGLTAYLRAITPLQCDWPIAPRRLHFAPPSAHERATAHADLSRRLR